ncbi:putative pentatricopeptide repeat-containing protein [Nymphaea thermarum]|nr:putative pentatricopeptide repeat-containing protein [Nymphaea thermarum]
MRIASLSSLICRIVSHPSTRLVHLRAIDNAVTSHSTIHYANVEPHRLKVGDSVATRLHAHEKTSKLLENWFNLALEECTARNLVEQGQQVHAQIIVHGVNQSVFLGAKLISMYSKLNLLMDARMVFECLHGCNSNSLSWNAILRANLKHGFFEEALELYERMRVCGVRPDGFTFPLVIRACTETGDVGVCRKVHEHVLELGFELHLHVANGLIGMYGKLGRMDVAGQLFDRMPQKNVFSWNTMMSGLALNFDCDGAAELFREMDSGKLKPNLITWTSLISSHAKCGRPQDVMDLFREMNSRSDGTNAEVVAVVLSVCTDAGSVEKGKVVHGLAVKSGLESYCFVKSALISVYGKCGEVDNAYRLFLDMDQKDIITWNSMMSCYASSGRCDEAYELLCQLGKEHHGEELMPNVVSWSAVIDGFSACGRSSESLELFRRMQMAGVTPNYVTIATVLSSCAKLAVLYLGKEIHGHSLRGFLDLEVLVINGLIHMYAKCGNLQYAHRVFDRMIRKDLISWNSIIAGYAMHGLGRTALCMFDEMLNNNLKPDNFTFIAVLSACSHAGLVNEGRLLFDRMTREYLLSPSVEHYACMVDLLGRAGLVNEASKFVRELPLEANACVWGALLNSCRIHKNTVVAEETASRLFDLEPKTTGSYMLLSNTYAACGRWEDSAKIRLLTRVKGLKKSPGHSWIEVKSKVYMFSAGNSWQPGLEEIYGVLETLVLLMENDDHMLNGGLCNASYG